MDTSGSVMKLHHKLPNNARQLPTDKPIPQHKDYKNATNNNGVTVETTDLPIFLKIKTEGK